MRGRNPFVGQRAEQRHLRAWGRAPEFRQPTPPMSQPAPYRRYPVTIRASRRRPRIGQIACSLGDNLIKAV
jgi:hypothetical protein